MLFSAMQRQAAINTVTDTSADSIVSKPLHQHNPSDLTRHGEFKLAEPLVVRPLPRNGSMPSFRHDPCLTVNRPQPRSLNAHDSKRRADGKESRQEPPQLNVDVHDIPAVLSPVFVSKASVPGTCHEDSDLSVSVPVHLHPHSFYSSLAGKSNTFKSTGSHYATESNTPVALVTSIDINPDADENVGQFHPEAAVWDREAAVATTLIDTPSGRLRSPHPGPGSRFVNRSTPGLIVRRSNSLRASPRGEMSFSVARREASRMQVHLDTGMSSSHMATESAVGRLDITTCLPAEVSIEHIVERKGATELPQEPMPEPIIAPYTVMRAVAPSTFPQVVFHPDIVLGKGISPETVAAALVESAALLHARREAVARLEMQQLLQRREGLLRRGAHAASGSLAVPLPALAWESGHDHRFPRVASAAVGALLDLEASASSRADRTIHSGHMLARVMSLPPIATRGGLSQGR
jgi:hypothetical protein